MDWITKEEIREVIRHTQGDRKILIALEYTILHWEQIYDATLEELIKADSELLSNSFCAMCVCRCSIKIDCDLCLIGSAVGKCSSDSRKNPWFPALEGYKHLRMGIMGTWRFKRRVKRMLKLLYRLSDHYAN